MNELSGYRIVAVHAHPDDEAITTGGALAYFSSRGADVTVITCTLGEEGEVIGETYRHLVNDEADQLGGFRIGELGRALETLGVRGVHLGGAGRFRDSGMAGSPSAAHPRAFVNSGEAAVEELTGLFERLRPHLVLTYGPDGGYGHPDHIRAHEITHAAAQRVTVPRILWAVHSRAEMDEALAAIEEIPAGWRRSGDGELAAVDKVDAWLELDDQLYHRKREAMRAHATQLWIADGGVSATNPRAARAQAPDTVYALSNLIAQPIMRREHYQFGAGVPLVEPTDLLAGIER